MAQPQATTIEEAAEKILNLSKPEESEVTSDEVTNEEVAPEETPSEEVQASEETTEEVIEAQEEPEVTEDNEFVTDLNEWLTSGQFDGVEVPVKINGTEGKTSLADLVKDYQIYQSSEERLNALKEDKSKFLQEKEQLLSNLNAQLTQASELTQTLEKQFVDEFNSIDWKELRETDPAEFSAKRQELLERQEQVNGIKQGIYQKQQEAIRDQMQKTMQEQSVRIKDLIPEWSDDSVAQQEKSSIREYLINSGFNPVEVDGAVDANGNIQSVGIVDARAIALARKAMLYDQGSKKLDIVKKKVVKVPKVAKPGKPQVKEDEKTELLNKQKSRLRKSGKMEDAANLISQLL